MPGTVNFVKRIQKLLPDDLIEFIRLITNIASKNNRRLYLVGGVVRDLLLNQSNMDIDIVVEGDAISIAREIPVVDGKITVYHNFRTVKLKRGKWSIDITSARSEIYTRPGALPVITLSTLEKDLMRRDFTINSIAVSLNDFNYGELIDPYKGITDLRHKYIRILHVNSFTDDATRILRALKYEQRLGFIIEPDTLKLLKRDLDLLDTISSDRMRHEIDLLLKELKPENGLVRAAELGVLRKIHPSLNADSWLSQRFEEARKLGLSNSFLTVVYLALFIYHLKPAELDEFLLRLHYNKKISQVLTDTLALKDILPRLNKKQIANSEIYFTLCQFCQPSIIANLLAFENPTVVQKINLYLTRLMHIKPRLNGNDLKRMQIPNGPDIKEILHILHVARLDGKINTKQGEIRLLSSRGYNIRHLNHQ